jgi:hypothetical protein
MIDKTIYFFANGATAAVNKWEQIPEIQQSWLVVFLEFLEHKGVDPTTCDFHLPSGRVARVFKTSENEWNWEIYGA